jgi:alginate O-acetyltransferase complex protein AlgJ
MSDAMVDTRLSAPAGTAAGDGYPLRFRSMGAISGVLFLVLMGLGAITGAYAVIPALAHVETPSLRNGLRGEWGQKFEKALTDALPQGTPARMLWSRVEYALFHQGRKGIVIGTNGWLYTDEELSCPAQFSRSLGDNLDFIATTRARLAQAGTELAVVLVPAKARVVPEHLGSAALPACRIGVYGRISDYLSARGIPVVNLMEAMRTAPERDDLFLKTDTHWTPEGARLAARQAAYVVRASFPQLGLPVQSFTSKPGEAGFHEGDLLRYVPGVSIAREIVRPWTTESRVTTASAGSALFDDAGAPQVALVGTSYSANPKWNFAGFLKESLSADVLNAAQEGQGPFAVMDKYLEGDAWKSSPPRLVVWEMPVRYFLMPHGVSGN